VLNQVSQTSAEPIRVCIAGATGWVGSLLVRHILKSSEFTLAGAIARRRAGEDIGAVLGLSATGVYLTPSLDDALKRPTDVLVDYTGPDSVKQRALDALRHGVHAVIGTSGLSASDLTEIETEAAMSNLGVIAAGNFSITAALAKHFAMFAARHVPSWELIDYGRADKPDAPSGTTRELAEELAGIGPSQIGFPLEQTHGAKEARGANISGTQVHSVRLPGFVSSFEVIFGLADERLTIRHDSGNGAAPYVSGTLLAVRKVTGIRGLVRGLDRMLFAKE